jgi:hypothetical protein
MVAEAVLPCVPLLSAARLRRLFGRYVDAWVQFCICSDCRLAPDGRCYLQKGNLRPSDLRILSGEADFLLYFECSRFICNAAVWRTGDRSSFIHCPGRFIRLFSSQGHLSCLGTGLSRRQALRFHNPGEHYSDRRPPGLAVGGVAWIWYSYASYLLLLPHWHVMNYNPWD